MAEDSTKELTEEEAVARGWRPVRALVPGAEAEPRTVATGSASNISANETYARDTPKSAAERTQEYRERAKQTRGVAQLNLLTTTDPAKRETLKALGQAIVRDDVHAVCTMAVRSALDPRRLDAMERAGEVPGIVDRGFWTSANDDIRRVVDAVVENAEIRDLVLACLADKSALLGLCSAISKDTTLKRLAAAAKANSRLAKIFIGMASSAPAALENIAAAIHQPSLIEWGKRVTESNEIRRTVEAALKRPRATALGHAILSCPGRRGRVLRWVLKVTLSKQHFPTTKQVSKL